MTSYKLPADETKMDAYDSEAGNMTGSESPPGKPARKPHGSFAAFYARKHLVVYVLIATSAVAVIVGYATTGVGIFDVGLRPDPDMVIFFRRPPVHKSIREAMKEPTLWHRSQTIFLVLGSTAIIKGALGFAVAVKHSVTLLIIYIGALVLIIVGQSFGLALGLWHQSKTQGSLSNVLLQTIGELYSGSTVDENLRMVPSAERVSVAWDNIMMRYECCGASNFRDFKMFATRWNRGVLFRGAVIHSYVPVTCCKMNGSEFADLGKCIENRDKAYINIAPCKPVLDKVIGDSTRTPMTLFIALLLVDVAGLTVAGYLLHMVLSRERLRKRNTRQRGLAFSKFATMTAGVAGVTVDTASVHAIAAPALTISNSKLSSAALSLTETLYTVHHIHSF